MPNTLPCGMRKVLKFVNISSNMTNSEEFMAAVASVRACRGTVACGCEMSELDEMAGDCLYVACKEYIKAYAERFPAWHGLP